MGICGPNGHLKTRTTNAVIPSEAEQDQNMLKLLLLGTGGTGKSTILKQLLMYYSDRLGVWERREYIRIIHQNLIDGMRSLVLGNQDLCSEGSLCDKQVGDYIVSLDGGERVSKTMAEIFKKAWADRGIQETWRTRSKLQVQDSLKYFIGRIDAITSENYTPSKDDVLHVRARTTGISMEKLTINNRAFEIVDVGGQRSERRKWVNCFDDVNAVIFVDALISYNQTLYEDETVNRMKDSLLLFKTLCSEKMSAFKDASIILFLNKSDLFSEFVRNEPITTCFPEYAGLLTEDAQYEYIKSMYERQNTTNRKIFVHRTCATNTIHMKVMFNTVNHAIIDRVLSKSGYLVPN